MTEPSVVGVTAADLAEISRCPLVLAGCPPCQARLSRLADRIRDALSVPAAERERIKAALPDLVARHRENLVYTPPEGWEGRWRQHLARLLELVDGDR